MITVISEGWGGQSLALACMSAVGDLPHADVVIHADTTHERTGTYEIARKYTPWLEARGIRVVTVSDQPAAERVWRGEMIPAYTADGGRAFRTCTHRWKILPMRRWLRANFPGETFEMWLGITLDEVTRMKPSNVQYITNRWPLIERRMYRWDCEKWLTEHGIDVPPKSACVFCPLHSNRAWRQLREEGGADWRKAVAIDEITRHARPPDVLYLSNRLKPLEALDLSTPQDHGQLELSEQDECQGVCFL